MKNIFCLFLVLFPACLLQAQEKSGKPIIAVLAFKNTTGKFYLDEVSRSFPALLKTELAQAGSMVIVEREKMDAVMKEQDFVLSDLSDDKDKQEKVGELLGADFLITGDVSESGGQLRIDVAMTRTMNGQVIAEKVTGPSKKALGTMAHLLANNMAFDLTGEGSKMSRISLKGAPTTTFILTTAALSAGAYFASVNSIKFRDAYQKNSDFSKMDSKYKKANAWRQATRGLEITAVVSAGALIYAFLKNRASDLDVLASQGALPHQHMALQPYVDGHGERGFQLSVTF